MKILFISKYPPIEGGVSSRNYWLAKALGERGAEVSMVTNALAVEDEYREKMDLYDVDTLKKHQPKNVFFYSLGKDVPRHIPYSPAYVSRLVNLGLKALGERGADVIYAHYLEPYAAAGYVLKKITGLPLIVRHAGSDIYRLLRSPDFRYFLGRILQEADCLLLSRSLYPLAKTLEIDQKRIRTMTRVAIDDAAFNPNVDPFNFAERKISIPQGIPVITYMGKAAANKGISETMRALLSLKKDFRLLMVSQGNKFEEFSQEAAALGISEKVIYLGFVPPWLIPGILRASSALLHLENNFPIPIHSPIQPLEAIAASTSLVLSAEIYRKIKIFFPQNAQNFNVVEKVSDENELKQALSRVFDSKDVLKENAKKIREEFISQNDWKGFVESYFAVFKSLAHQSKF